jgi:hypothetical protein
MIEKMPQLVDQKVAAEMLAVTPHTMERWRYEGVGPEYIKIGSGRRGIVRYDVRVLLAFIRANTHVPSVRAAQDSA